MYLPGNPHPPHFPIRLERARESAREKWIMHTRVLSRHCEKLHSFTYTLLHPSVIIFRTIFSSHSTVNRLVVRRQGRLLNRLAQRGVAVAGAGDVFRGPPVLHRKNGLLDELARGRADDVCSQHFVRLRV